MPTCSNFQNEEEEEGNDFISTRFNFGSFQTSPIKIIERKLTSMQHQCAISKLMEETKGQLQLRTAKELMIAIRIDLKRNSIEISRFLTSLSYILRLCS